MDGKGERRTSILLGPGHTSAFNRVLAKAIDVLVVIAIYFLASAVWRPFGVLGAAVFCAVQDAMGSGQSVGKRIIGLSVVDDLTGSPCTLQDSCLRNFPFALSVLFAAIPVLWVFFLLITLPVVAFEVYLLLSLESGVRLGDVLGNTLVVEHVETSLDAMS